MGWTVSRRATVEHIHELTMRSGEWEFVCKHFADKRWMAIYLRHAQLVTAQAISFTTSDDFDVARSDAIEMLSGLANALSGLIVTLELDIDIDGGSDEA